MVSRLFPDVPASTRTDQAIHLPPVILGGGVFGTDYNSLDTLHSTVPERTLRLALQHGINTIDTSPYYSCSEEVLGRAFAAVADEFPRASYQIITKAGRYGRTKATGFDYSPARIRASIETSLALMGTTYLDGVYMHDVEFVAEQVADAGDAGWKVAKDGTIQEADLVRWGLAPGDEGKIRGPGDQKVLDAIECLLALKREGKIRWVGFSGFPLPTLLRLARLVAAHLQPLDIIQSYSHHCLQNTTLASYLPLFYAAGVKQVVSASPLSMGILRDVPPPDWHPASPEMRKATEEAVQAVAQQGSTLQAVALGYGLTSALLPGEDGSETPTVVGLSTPEEVEETARVYASLYSGVKARKGRRPGEGDATGATGKQVALEKLVVDIYRSSGTENWTWASGTG